MSSKVMELSLYRDLNMVGQVAEFVSKVSGRVGLSEEKAGLLGLTLQKVLELRERVLVGENPKMEVLLLNHGDRLEVRVTDMGRPYIIPAQKRWFLNNGLVDGFAFEQNGAKGQTFSFSYNVDREYVPDAPAFEENDRELLDTNFVYRQVTKDDEDVLQSIRLLYGIYAFEYLHQDLYSVERFMAQMENGTYYPVIGTNAHGQAVCFAAVTEHPETKGLVEYGNLVTNPIARGNNCAGEITKVAEQEAIKAGFSGIYVEAVGYHPITQKICNKNNYSPCGAVFSGVPAKVRSQYDGSGKQGDLLLCAKLLKKDGHGVYVEDLYADFVRKFFDSEGVPCKIVTSTSYVPESDLGQVVTNASQEFKLVNIYFNECSKSYEREIEAMLASEELNACDVATIYVNMSNETGLLIPPVLRANGLMFTGILPGSNNGDYMIFQKFKNAPAFDEIVTEPNYKELIDTLLCLAG